MKHIGIAYITVTRSTVYYIHLHVSASVYSEVASEAADSGGKTFGSTMILARPFLRFLHPPRLCV